MSCHVRRVMAVSVVIALIVSASPIHGQSGGSCQHSGGAPMTGSMRQNRQSTQSQQSLQSSLLGAAGGTSLTGTNPSAQQANLSSVFMLQQQQLAVSVALQQLQAQQQAAGLAPNARLQTVSEATAAAVQRKQQKALFDEPEEKSSKPEIKRMAEESDEDASSKQLWMANDIKRDTDAAQAKGDRARATKLRAIVEQRLSDIQEKYPNTPAAQDAEKIRASLYR
jgi:hypothetical protein